MLGRYAWHKVVPRSKHILSRYLNTHMFVHVTTKPVPHGKGNQRVIKRRCYRPFYSSTAVTIFRCLRSVYWHSGIVPFTCVRDPTYPCTHIYMNCIPKTYSNGLGCLRWEPPCPGRNFSNRILSLRVTLYCVDSLAVALLCSGKCSCASSWMTLAFTGQWPYSLSTQCIVT